MNEYILLEDRGVIIRIADNKQIVPCDDINNPDYQEYLSWINNGNVVESISSSNVVDPNRIITKYEFRKRFTFNELKILMELKKTVVDIEVIYETLMIADHIDLNDPILLEALDVFVQCGIIAPERKIAVLA